MSRGRLFTQYLFAHFVNTLARAQKEKKDKKKKKKDKTLVVQEVTASPFALLRVPVQYF